MQQQNTQKVEASKVPEYIKKAAKKAAEFNSNLNRERMEERRAYFDLQTHVGTLSTLPCACCGCCWPPPCPSPSQSVPAASPLLPRTQAVIVKDGLLMLRLHVCVCAHAHTHTHECL